MELTGAPQVFISWAHSDRHRPRIEAFVDALQRRGVSAFVDFERMGAGDDLPERIRAGIDGARMLVVWWSDEYQVSWWCRAELYRTLLASALAPPSVEGGRPGRVPPIVVVNPDASGPVAGLESLAGALGDRLVAGPVPPDGTAAIEGLAGRVGELLATRAFSQPIAGVVSAGAVPTRLAGVGRSELGYQRFVGRLVEVWRLHEALTRAADDPLALSGSSSNRVALVKGGGGFGKSLLATHYADRFAAVWPTVVWMRALGNPADGRPVDRDQVLADAWSAVAADLGLDVGELTVEQKRREVTRHIDEAGQRVLWIVDDLASDDDPDDWVCDSGWCAVIVTTRSDRLREMTVIEVGELTEAEALALFARHGLDVTDDAERDAAAGLSRWLGFHALAVDVAGAYMATARLGFAEYRQLIEASLRRFDQLTRTIDLRLPGGHEPQIVATLATSIERLGDDARFLLRAAADLAQSPMSVQLVEEVLRFRPDTEDSDRSVESGTRPISAVDALFVGNGEGLWRTDRHGNQRTVTVHTLAAATARELVDIGDEAEFREQLAAAVLATLKLVPWGDVSRHGELGATLPHARTLTSTSGEPTGEHGLGLWNAVLVTDEYAGAWAHDHATRNAHLENRHACHEAHRRILGPDHPDTLTAKANLAASLWALGDAAAARTLQEDVLASRERILGPDHPDTLTAKANLANSLRALGDAAAARTLEEDVLASSERILGPDHPSTLTAKANLAGSLWALGDAAAARTLQEDVLASSERILGPDHPDTLTAKANLANSLRALGDAAAARTLEQDVLASRERILGPDHPSTLTAKANLAGSLRALGDAAAARTLQQDVLASSGRILGPDHPSTLTAKANLAASLRALGDAAAARTLEQEVLASSGRILGPDHPDTLTAKANLAHSLRALGDAAAARTLEQDVLASRERILGADHPDTLTAKANLAASLRALGDATAARTLQEDVLASRERILRADHPDTLTAKANLAHSLRALGDAAAARTLEQDVLASSGRILGPDHPDTLTAKANLAASLWALGDAAAARTLEQDVLASRERILGADHPDTLTAKANLASSLWALGDAAAARTLQEEVLASRERILGADHPDTLTAKANLATSLWALGDAAAARTLQEDVLASRERILGPDHPDTLTAKANLAHSLRALGDATAARTLQEDVLASRERILGPDHPDTLTAKATLAVSVWNSGDRDAAIDLTASAHQAALARHGQDHPITVHLAGLLTQMSDEMG